MFSLRTIFKMMHLKYKIDHQNPCQEDDKSIIEKLFLLFKRGLFKSETWWRVLFLLSPASHLIHPEESWPGYFIAFFLSQWSSWPLPGHCRHCSWFPSPPPCSCTRAIRWGRSSPWWTPSWLGPSPQQSPCSGENDKMVTCHYPVCWHFKPNNWGVVHLSR